MGKNEATHLFLGWSYSTSFRWFLGPNMLFAWLEAFLRNAVLRFLCLRAFLALVLTRVLYVILRIAHY